MSKPNFVFIFTMLFTSFVAFTGCKGGKDKVLELDKMKLIFWDQAMAEEYSEYYVKKDTTIKYDSARSAIMQKVLMLHNTDSAEYINSLNHYRASPKLFKILMDSLNEYGSRQREAAFHRQYTPPPSKSISDSTLTVTPE